MKPPRFLKGGETIELGIDKLGTQTHKVRKNLTQNAYRRFFKR